MNEIGSGKAYRVHFPGFSILNRIFYNFFKVFYYKMKGDYHRYLAEFATANERKDAAENSLVAYKAASDVALTELPTTHPIR